MLEDLQCTLLSLNNKALVYKGFVVMSLVPHGKGGGI